MNWKSNYKIPLSFIIFFVLTFFLIGEQLPALPTYLLGSSLGGDGPGKVHILDLRPTDALHRPIVYMLLGIIIWLLFRKFSWPIASILVAIIAILEQFFLTPSDHRPEVTFHSTLIILIAMGVFTLVPYFIYRTVDRKWGGDGKRNAILITLIVNFLLFGFFAYQIFYLHNSYQIDSTPRLPSNTCPDRLITEKDKPTTAYWNGQILEVAAKEQKWVEANCPGVLNKP